MVADGRRKIEMIKKIRERQLKIKNYEIGKSVHHNNGAMLHYYNVLLN